MLVGVLTFYFLIELFFFFQNKALNRHIINLIFLELKIVKITINRQICQLC